MKQRLRLSKSGSFLHIFLLIALSTNNLSSTSTAQGSPAQIVKVEEKDQGIVQVEDCQLCTICPTDYTRGPAYAPSDLHDPETDEPIFLQPLAFQSMFEGPVLGYGLFQFYFCLLLILALGLSWLPSSLLLCILLSTPLKFLLMAWPSAITRI